jgi:hypothetical protein
MLVIWNSMISYPMKSKVLKILTLLATFAAGVLIVGEPLSRRLLPLTQTAHPARRYPHEHLRPSELEPAARLTDLSYTLREGETLADIATLRYGHRYYYRVIKLYNHIEDEDRVGVGVTVRLPDLSTILAEEGFTRVAAAEHELILCSRAKYDPVNGQLQALRLEAKTGRYTIPEGVKQALLEAADDLEQACDGLNSSKPGVTKAPQSMIGQLRENVAGMRELAEGSNDGYGYDLDMVQQRYAFALTDAVIWAREGFR